MPERYKVVITDTEFGGAEIEKKVLEGIGAEVTVLQTMDEEKIMRATEDADAVITEYAKLTAKVIGNMKKCRVISRYGIGVDMIDLEAAGKAGIPVANAPDYGIEEVATHTAALILALARKVTVYDRELKKGKWGYQLGMPIHRIQGEILGLVGYGNISRMVGRFMSGMGMKVVAYDPFIPAEKMAEQGAEKAGEVNELLAVSDFVSLHVPLMAETRGMIGEKELKTMKPSAGIINTGRGGLIDEAALVTALKENWISNAAIDTFPTEPIAWNNPLLKLDNVIVSPHCAFYSAESLQNLQRIPAEEIVRVLEGGKPKNLVNGKWLKEYGKGI
jgi:D-3-phosphoglycerate dehydrogenase